MGSPFLRFLALARPHRWLIGLGIALILLSTLVALPAPWIFGRIVDQAIPTRDFNKLGWLLLAFALLFFLRAAASMLRNIVLQRAGMRLCCDMRIRVFTHLQSLSLRYFDAHQTGRTVARVAWDTGEIHNLINGFLINTLADTVTLVGVAALLFALDWRLALATCALLPFIALNYLYHRRKLQQELRVHRDNWDAVMSFLHEKIGAPRIIKSFARERDEVEQFSRGIETDYFHFTKIILRHTKLAVAADVLTSLGTLLVIGLGAWLVMTDRSTLGRLVEFYGYIGLVFGPVARLVDLNAALQRANTCLANVFELLDTRPEVADRPGARELSRLRGEVEFSDVSFDYEPAEEGKPERPKTLSHVSFRVPAGQRVAIVGPSGAGKSTIINLLARFYDPSHGAVRVDGIDLREVSLESLRRQIGIVLQESVLFSGSIEENLRYGKPDASPEEVLAAARAANAHEFIERLDEGYRTLVGERGVKLSGGQRQRLAIARAILRDPRLLIFDEATSALDSESEHLVQEAMERLMHGRTTFIIAHRLSTIQGADRILVMDHGRLVEEGAHARLLARGGLYARLHALQFQTVK